MSGTSLDGLDIVCCEIKEFNERFSFIILQSETIEYSAYWKKELSEAFFKNATELKILDLKYGEFLSQCINSFLKKHLLQVELVSSHGHTIFHQPDQGITIQIGSSNVIRSFTGITTVNNFRLQDVRLGGQGAPLVPIGDKYLFADYDYCLNLGGFSNVSCDVNNRRIACDLSPCNILLNSLSQQLGHAFDESGNLSMEGNIIDYLLNKWNSYDFFKQSYPKSLGREWFEEHYLQNILNDQHSVQDKLRTSTEHIAFQVSNWINHSNQNKSSKLLITGGGAFNTYLISRIRYFLDAPIEIVIPSQEIINYKEAVIFAFLGYLRITGKNNVLGTVTGAEIDHCSGDIYW